MLLVKQKGTRTTHAAPHGVPLCGAQIGADRTVAAGDGAPTCAACRAVLADRKRRRETREGGPGIDPFVQIKLSRNASGNAQWELVVPYGATQGELNEVHRLAVKEYDALERDLG